ncbi:hypothetical protein [Prevotella intermedia]|uniref:Uncharacterized protein n=1 Tax=Prevotella intermedia TaxID=28131 RepID=A0A2A6EEC8_PREIN|nr:hypothetical protein [Prevotella intermedia]PDP59655.1 hypothetical protein CLI71_08480 [Prevotella intermedia]
MENKKITISNGLTKDEELEKDLHFDYRAYLEGYYDDKIIPVEETEEYKFCRILTKTPFEDDAKAIYDDLCRIKTGDISIQKEEERQRSLKHDRTCLGVANALLVLSTNNEVSLKGKNYEKELNPEMKKMLEEATLKIYKELRLDFTDMTFEEGKEILEGNLCDDIYEFMDEYWEEYAFEMGLNSEERAGGWNPEYIDDDMIWCYIGGKALQREITKQQITSVISTLEKDIKNNTKNGRPIKNIRLLCAIHVFMKQHNYRPNNSIYRIIGECVCFMELIDEDVIKGWKDKLKKKEPGQYFYPLTYYIKQMCAKQKVIDIEILPPLPF